MKTLKGASQLCRERHGMSLSAWAKEQGLPINSAAYRIVAEEAAPNCALFEVKGQWLGWKEACATLGIGRSALYLRKKKGTIRWR